MSDGFGRRVEPTWLALMLAACIAALPSCGGPSRVDVHPVRGQVLVSEATYEMVKVADDATCADVRAALPPPP